MKWIGQHIYDLTARFRGDVTIEGDLTVNGTYTQIDTDVTTTEQWLVTNDGTGPAAIINQKGSQDIFDVQDDGVSALYVKDGGNIGIGTTSPSEALDVFGNIKMQNNNALMSENVAGGTRSLIALGNDNVLRIKGNDSEGSSNVISMINGGNVGIGTTSPGHKLSISGGNAQISHTEPTLFFNDTTTGHDDWKIYADWDKFYIQQYVGDSSYSTRLMSDASGNIGIGTTAPTSPLTIKSNSTSSSDSGLTIQGVGNTNPILKIAEKSTDGGRFHMYDGGVEKIAFYTDGTANHISAGNVGIGTTSPAKKLDVVGTGKFSSRLTAEDFKSSLTTINLLSSGSEFAVNLDNSVHIFGTGFTGTPRMQPATTNEMDLGRSSNKWKNLYLSGNVFSDGTGDNHFTGNVGIGTTSPSEKMQVNGVLAITANDTAYAANYFTKIKSNYSANPFIIESKYGDLIKAEDYGKSLSFHTGEPATSERMRITSAGNVGIGTTSPGRKLTVAGSDNLIFLDSTGNSYLTIDRSATNRRSAFVLSTAGNGTSGIPNNINWALGAADSDEVGDGTGFFIGTSTNATSSKLFIEQSGNVGIGTTSPGVKLEVSGDHIRLSDAYSLQWVNANNRIYNQSNATIFVNNASESMRITSAGNVGIGTTAPTAPLQIGATTTAIAISHSDDIINEVNSISIRTDSSANGNIDFRKSGNIYYNTADLSGIRDFTIYEGKDSSNAVLTITGGDNVGNVGIGTTSPAYPLHIATDSSSYAAYIKNSNSNGGGLVVSAANGGGGTNPILDLRDSSDNVKVRVVENGNVGIGITAPTQALHLPDSKKLALGTGADLQILHDGSNSYISNHSGGHLYIQQNLDDQDIVLQCDDGSGGTTAYLTLDGSTTQTLVHKDLRFDNNIGAVFGSGAALKLHSDGSNGIIDNFQGNLIIRQQVDDADIIFQSDNGSGGVATYFYLDGSIDNSNLYTVFPDNAIVTLGTGYDLQLYHDSSNSYMVNLTGNLTIRNVSSDSDILFRGWDGGSDITALTLDMSDAGTAIFNHDIKLSDSSRAYFGNSLDVSMFHNGTDTYIDNNNGNFYIRNYANDKDIIFQSDDGSGGVAIYTMLDGSEGRISTKVNNRFDDSARLELGTSGDLDLYHDGSHSYINNATGDLVIRNQANDADVILQSDDGSGGTTPYLTLDGGDVRTNVHKEIRFDDNTSLKIGSGGDLVINHNSGNNYIGNVNGHLDITQYADDKDIIFQADDGSGGTTAYLTLDGSATTTVFAKNTRIEDSVLHQFGSSNDMAIYHNGTDSFVTNDTGDLRIRQFANDKDIIFDCDDGSGGVETYFFLDGSASSGNPVTCFPDNSAATWGDGYDLILQHNGTNSEILNQIGNLTIKNFAADKDIIFQCDDGSGGETPYLTLDGSAGYTTVQKKIQFGDSVEATFGAGNDLKIAHISGNNYITGGTGNLYIRNGSAADKDIVFQADNGSGGNTAYLTLDGSAETIVVDKPLLINGAAIKASPNLYDNIIKLLPSDFVTNDNAGVTKFGIGYVDTAGGTYGMKPTNADTELYTFVSIPQGMKATHVDVYDKYNKGVIVYEAQINATTLTSKGTGNCNTQIDITDVNSTATNFLAIQVTTTATSDRVFGGQVTIAAI